MKRWLVAPGILAAFVGTYFFFVGGNSNSPPQSPAYKDYDNSSSLRRFSVPGIPAVLAKSSVVDNILLSDEPGNWFRSENLGIPISIINKNDTVEFDLKSVTDVSHTVTLLMSPTDSELRIDTIDQDEADDDDVRVQFNDPGVYLFACKVHPYMMGVVAVLDPDDVLHDEVTELTVSGEELGFIDRVDGVIGDGLPVLPATTVASILSVLAPFDGATPPGLAALGLSLDKTAKWDIRPAGGTIPPTPGVGEVWINAQFEAVDHQQDTDGNPKPGTIIVLDASTLLPKMIPIDGVDGNDPDPNVVVSGDNGWNNPHNMWANARLDTIYNGNWFGQWLNRIDRSSGTILETIDVGDGPTHIVTNPNENSPEFGILTLPLSAEEDILKIVDDGSEFDIEDKIETGEGPNHPHGQWISSDGSTIVIPNVFQGLGFGGSVTIMDTDSGDIIREIMSTDPDGGNLLLPVAASVRGNDRAYVSSIVSGMVSVIDLKEGSPTRYEIINDIRVACFNLVDGTCGTALPVPAIKAGIVLDTLKLPIQTPASPDGKFVVTAVFSLASGLAPDTIAVIDANANSGMGELVAELECPAGCHGVNWGAKFGGGYYAYVTSQHSNVLTVVDPDPNMDGDATDAAIVGQVSLSNDDETKGTGGQGILPIPLVSNGWVQDTVAERNDGNTSTEISGFIDALTPCQRDPSAPGC